MICSSPETESVSDFVCRNNIFHFLTAAVNNFDLDPDEYFFDMPDLYQYKDISKVIFFSLKSNVSCVLPVLSHSILMKKKDSMNFGFFLMNEMHK